MHMQKVGDGGVSDIVSAANRIRLDRLGDEFAVYTHCIQAAVRQKYYLGYSGKEYSVYL